VKKMFSKTTVTTPHPTLTAYTHTHTHVDDGGYPVVSVVIMKNLVRYLRRLLQSGGIREGNELGMKQGRGKTVAVTDSSKVVEP
jgi:hypothetical protein